MALSEKRKLFTIGNRSANPQCNGKVLDIGSSDRRQEQWDQPTSLRNMCKLAEKSYYGGYVQSNHKGA